MFPDTHSHRDRESGTSPCSAVANRNALVPMNAVMFKTVRSKSGLAGKAALKSIKAATSEHPFLFPIQEHTESEEHAAEVCEMRHHVGVGNA